MTVSKMYRTKKDLVVHIPTWRKGRSSSKKCRRVGEMLVFSRAPLFNLRNIAPCCDVISPYMAIAVLSRKKWSFSSACINSK